jgi:predicted ester cyclase
MMPSLKDNLQAQTSETTGPLMQENANIELIRAVFSSAEQLDPHAVDHQFTDDFEMFSNDVHWDLQTYKQYHVESYENRKQIQVDILDIFGQADRVAGRVSITLMDLQDNKREFQVMFIAQIKDGRVFRLWELTYPHWN